MEFHPEKCNVRSISGRKNPLIFDYSLHDHLLEHVKSATYLGVTINSKLNWDDHVNNIAKKANRTQGFIRRNLKIRSEKIKEKAYQTIVRPLVEYASCVWDPYITYQKNQIEMVQRRGARFVTGDYSRNPSVSDMITNLNWSPRGRHGFRTATPT